MLDYTNHIVIWKDRKDTVYMTALFDLYYSLFTVSELINSHSYNFMCESPTAVALETIYTVSKVIEFVPCCELLPKNWRNAIGAVSHERASDR